MNTFKEMEKQNEKWEEEEREYFQSCDICNTSSDDDYDEIFYGNALGVDGRRYETLCEGCIK